MDIPENRKKRLPRFPIKSTGTQKARKAAALRSDLLRSFDLRDGVPFGCAPFGCAPLGQGSGQAG